MNQAYISGKQPLSSTADLVHGMIKQISDECTDILLPQPRPIKQDSIYLPCAAANLMLLVLQNQNAKLLQRPILPVVSMSDHIMFAF